MYLLPLLLFQMQKHTQDPTYERQYEIRQFQQTNAFQFAITPDANKR